MPKENNYNDLVALKGPDQVRLRPGVIFGSDSVDGCRHSVLRLFRTPSTKRVRATESAL